VVISSGRPDGGIDGLGFRPMTGWPPGIYEGLEQGERRILLRQLRRRFGSQVDGEAERRLEGASAEQIEVWAERVLSVATLAELLAD